MKVSCAFVFAAVLASAMGGHAETKDATTINIEGLARVDAITAYCNRVDNKNLLVHMARQGAFVRSHSSSELNADRNTARYKAAYDALSLALTKVQPATGAQKCSALAKGL